MHRLKSILDAKLFTVAIWSDSNVSVLAHIGFVAGDFSVSFIPMDNYFGSYSVSVTLGGKDISGSPAIFSSQPFLDTEQWTVTSPESSFQGD